MHLQLVGDNVRLLAGSMNDHSQASDWVFVAIGLNLLVGSCSKMAQCALSSENTVDTSIENWFFADATTSSNCDEAGGGGHAANKQIDK